MSNANFYKGIAFALGACLIWGLIFVVPLFMEEYSPLEIALGRFVFYGVISLSILSIERLRGGCDLPKSVWLKAFYYSVFPSIIYYTSLVLSLRYATPAICALILGISPITIAFYGNWKEKECSYKSLILPSIFILVGLGLINVPHFQATLSPLNFAFGLVCSCISLLTWSWYVVANSRFLKANPHVASGNWSTVLGVTTLAWTAITALFIGIFFRDGYDFDKYLTFDSNLSQYLAGCFILGLFCSWLGAYLWNRASCYLPVSLAGQLTIFETIFGLIFIYTLEQRLPPLMESVGIAILLSAVIYGIRSSSQVIQAGV